MNNEILSRLDILAQKLGTTAVHLWGVVVRQARIEAWSDLGIAILWLVFIFGVAKLYRVLTSDQADEGGKIVFSILGTLCLLISVYYFYSAASEFINPEFWALDHIIKSVK